MCEPGHRWAVVVIVLAGCGCASEDTAPYGDASDGATDTPDTIWLPDLPAGTDSAFTPSDDSVSTDTAGQDPGAGSLPDTSVPDVELSDAKALDSGPLDSGLLDSGPRDSSPLDSGSVDSGSVDSGSVDSGSVDSGMTDAMDTEIAPLECELDADCDDGLSCTANTCVAGECLTLPSGTCPWPAETLVGAVNLTPVEGPFINDFHENLSGAVWDPNAEVLWVCRNNNPSKIWALEPSGQDNFIVAERSGVRAEWSDFGDLEGLTLANLDEPNVVYLMVEGGGHIRELDLSTGDSPLSNNDWDLSAVLGGDGAEGITFVPDEFLQSDGFVGADGALRVSTQGMGGLMFVAHQSGGPLFVFDLNRTTGTSEFVGRYETARNESAGLEFDRSTGLLFILHGGDHNELEVTRLSSTALGDSSRQMDSIAFIDGPAPSLFGGSNYEGIALTSKDTCENDGRGFFLTIDGGGFESLFWFRQFPCL